MRKFLKRILICIKNPTIRIGKGANISRTAKFEGNNRLGAKTVFSGQIGKCSYIGDNCRISAQIGKFCSIANQVVTVAGTHPIRTWVSTHPAFYSTAKQCGVSFVSDNHFEETTPTAVIGHDVWIGSGAQLIGGVTIGNGAVIAAGAVVTKNVAPYAVVAGNPARELRKRFSEEDIAFLQEVQWWNQPEAWLKEHADCFGSVTLLKSLFGKNQS